MKKIAWLLLLFIICIPNLFAENIQPPKPSVKHIVSLDQNSDNKITPQSIASGTDDVFVRLVSQEEALKNSLYFTDKNHNYYLALSFEDLPKADANSDRRIDNKDPIYKNLLIARIDPANKSQLISVVTLKDAGVAAILLPSAIPDPEGKKTRLQAVVKDGGLVLVDSVPWQ